MEKITISNYINLSLQLRPPYCSILNNPYYETLSTKGWRIASCI